MRIGEFAEAAGTTAKTLRFYEEQGAPPPDRTSSGYRDYPPDAIARVDFVHRGQVAGLTLAQIRQIVDIRDAGHAPCAHVRDLLDARLRDIEQGRSPSSPPCATPSPTSGTTRRTPSPRPAARTRSAGTYRQESRDRRIRQTAVPGRTTMRSGATMPPLQGWRQGRWPEEPFWHRHLGLVDWRAPRQDTRTDRFRRAGSVHSGLAELAELTAVHHPRR